MPWFLRNRPRTEWRFRRFNVARSGLFAIVGASLCGCSSVLMEPKGPIGGAEKLILLDAVGVMLLIGVPTIVATLAVAWWFRHTNTGATHLPNWSYSGRVELLTWSVPLLIILFLGGMTWVGAHELDPGKPLAGSKPTLNIQVISLDWKWLFIYPDHNIASVNALTVPVNTPIHLTLTSASVMNTFFVPQLGSMLYTMNGMADNLYLQADEPGVYRGLSGHFSGDGFADMHFQVSAVSDADFAAWVARARAGGPALDAACYTELARQGTLGQPRTFSAVMPDLFNSVVRQSLPSGPGPENILPAPRPAKFKESGCLAN